MIDHELGGKWAAKDASLLRWPSSDHSISREAGRWHLIRSKAKIPRVNELTLLKPNRDRQ
jgi:hypothetical protein